MRWHDIILPRPEDAAPLAAACAETRRLAGSLPGLQQRDGLDAPTVTACMAEAGRVLLEGVRSVQPDAFVDEGPGTIETPELGDPAHDQLCGYHLVVPEPWLDLPWNWLHTGLAFVLEKHPVTWGTRPAGAERGRTARPWHARLQRARFLLDDEGATGLRGTIEQLRDGAARPDVLFVAGHSQEEIRRLIRREGDAVAAALGECRWGEPLASCFLPADTPTPTRLTEQAVLFQAIHYAGPTSQPAEVADAGAENWIDRLVLEAMALPDEEFDDEMGMEAKFAGVDQVTALLDQVGERFDREDGPHHALPPRATSKTSPGGPSWLLDDGPVVPETFGKGPGLPPLVVSNSHCAIPELGARFLGAGASTFIGPVAPLYSRPARTFAVSCWQALGEGWCAGAAAWRAAAELRRTCGDDHPAWLSYGVQGNGLIALQYL